MDFIFAMLIILAGGIYLFFPEKGLGIHKYHLKKSVFVKGAHKLTARYSFLRFFGVVLLVLGLYILIFS
jgi:hypothetical protein